MPNPPFQQPSPSGVGGWGDGVARAFLGFFALVLLGAGLAAGWEGRAFFAAALFVLAFVMALLCGFYRSVEGSFDRPWLRIRFIGPARKTR